MAEILPFRKPGLKEKARARTLCQHGFHKWVVKSENCFDSKQGKLVTAYRCSRCGKEKNRAQ